MSEEDRKNPLDGLDRLGGPSGFRAGSGAGPGFGAGFSIGATTDATTDATTGGATGTPTGGTAGVAAAGTTATGATATGATTGSGTDATDEEQALRGLFAGAVQGLEPSHGALERLRHAVPARRARKRQALVGAAAAALLAGTAIPAALHLGRDPEGTTGHSAMAGHGETQPGKSGGSSDPHQNGTGAGAGRPSPAKSGGTGAPAGVAGGPTPSASASPSGVTSAGPTGTTDSGTLAGTGPGAFPPAGGAAQGVPGCTAGQLGVLGGTRSPEADGRVYGSFKVTNVSAKGCLVTGPDTVTAARLGSPPPPVPGPAVTVSGHTAGDPASGLLPDPSAEAARLVLEPNTSYEVRFAWVPSAESCSASSPGSSAKPPAGGSAQPPAGASDGEAAGATAADQQDGAAPQPSGVAVTHVPGTPPEGAPITRTTVATACGGVVYRTGIIPPGAP
ncbi:hypothetical protein ACIRP0_34870 [Streptomyces sp. NPDC101733]|uniref:hypothetical protein n=1 Tax=unclassified Streptomyces TaxID=2593676 RepID=UPI00381FBE38